MHTAVVAQQRKIQALRSSLFVSVHLLVIITIILWYLGEFYSYLDNWKKLVSNLNDIDNKEKKHMPLVISQIEESELQVRMSMNVTIVLLISIFHFYS